MLIVNKLGHSYLNVIKLENFCTTGEFLNSIITKPHKSCIFLYFFHNNFKDTKGTKMVNPILESISKIKLNTLIVIFFAVLNKKVDNFLSAPKNRCKFVSL